MKFSNSFKPISNPLILFDGVCNLCSSWVQFVIKRDPTGMFRFASLQSGIGQDFLKSAHYPSGEFTSIILVKGPDYYLKSGAVLRIMQKLKFPWSMMVVFLLVPPFLRNFVYDIVAKNRYRWFGKQDECMVPTPDLKSRFL